MTRMKAILTLVAALGFALSPLVSDSFAGFEPDQFPVPQTDPPIQPAGWAFSIWLVIYVWLIASAAFGLLRRAEDPEWDRPRWPVFASLAIGTAWIPVAGTSPFWATVLIWLMLAGAAAALLACPGKDRLWLAAPVGLYTGWLIAASSVATGILATGYGATPVIGLHAAFLLMALAIATWLLRIRTEPTLAIGTGWALIGILAANLDGAWPMIVLPIAGLALLAPLALRGLMRPA